MTFEGVKDDDVHIVDFSVDKHGLLKSAPISIDFYILALKPPMHKNLVYEMPAEDAGSSYMFVNSPNASQGWDVEQPAAGFVICASKRYLEKIAKNYSFFNYNSVLEAIFLTKDEEVLLWDLYDKTYREFKKAQINKDIILSYIALILSYTQTFYDRQFRSRSKTYNKVVTDFHQHLAQYFSENNSVAGLPSVAYFAQKSFLSPNYFGDLIKHLTGKSPIDHIHDYVLDLAKQKLLHSNLSISEISYSLGFDYPNYFARFFRKNTGFSPKEYRNQ
ncbi:Helix-turn-helix domain-containing protein [Mucilaginibacter gossypii]|uniref:Helix-turn-helix domain-containing protein n=2 Tax=Mucilaginibacter gossypii TaxID=551996 RepID=A0A1G8CQ31_9SPHI|nr:Helix-turn-helix domain-containing protein [Mucilaginibacter gossypii]